MAWSDRIVAAFPSEHPLAARDAIYWTDLAGETLILSSRDPGPQLEAHLMAKLASADIAQHIRRHAVTHATLPQLVGAGLGVALLSETSAEFGSHVAVRELRDAAGPSGLPYAAYFRRDHRNPALRMFLKLLRERYPSQT